MKRVTIDDLTAILRGGASRVGEAFTTPDADWMPIMAVRTGGGKVDLIALPQFDEPDEKATSIAGAAALMRDLGADGVAFLASAWIADVGEDVPEPLRSALINGTVRPREYAKRREVLILWAMERGGDGRMWTCPIERDGTNRPRLGEWSEAGEGRGALTDPLRDALAVA